MVRMATAAVGFHTSPKTQAAQAEQSSAQSPAGLYEMQTAMETCQGDQQCLMQAGTRFALLMQQGKLDTPAAPPMSDHDRFPYRKRTRLTSSHSCTSPIPSSASYKQTPSPLHHLLSH